jgi:hypothetical protein
MLKTGREREREKERKRERERERMKKERERQRFDTCTKCPQSSDISAKQRLANTFV